MNRSTPDQRADREHRWTKRIVMVGFVFVGIALAMVIWVAAARAEDACAALESAPSLNEACGFDCDEGDAESQQRAVEVARIEALEVECKAETAQELREARAEERREHARHRREWAHKPTVTLAIAREFAARLMRQTEYGLWWLDCKGGRIDRTHWSCKVSIFYRCLRGRIQVYGAGYEDGGRYYGAHGGRLRQCPIYRG